MGILENGKLLRRASLQPCALEFFWDVDEGHVSSIMDLNWALAWPEAPTFPWERQGIPEKLTHTKTPPCTDLISELEAALSDKGLADPCLLIRVSGPERGAVGTSPFVCKR